MYWEREFLKLPQTTASKPRSFTAAVTSINLLEVGGHQLVAKQRLKLSVPSRFGIKNGWFVAKVDMRNDGPDYINTMIKANELARREGLPVPPTTRFFVDENRNPGLLMTDMAGGGKSWLWGLNQDYHQEELETLRAMALNKKQLSGTIPRMIQSLAATATKAMLLLNFGSYHLRKDKETGKLDVVLLDFADFTYDHGVESESELWELNRRHINYFTNLLEKRAALC